MKKFGRLLSTLLALALVLSLAMPAMAEGADPVTFSLMFGDHPSQPYQADTWLLPQVALEKFNITLDMQAIPDASYPEKRNVTLASGELPSIIMGVDRSVANEYGAKGMFVNLMDYVDQMPNMKKAVEESALIQASMPSPTELYGIPAQIVTPGNVVSAGAYIMMARADIMEELGIEDPKTFDDFYNMLVKMKEAYPDSYPFINRQKADFLFGVFAAGLDLNAYPAGYCQTSWALFDEETGTFSNVMEEENFKFYIEFMKKLYDEKLLDPTYAADDTSIWESKLVSGQGFVSVDWFSRPEMMTNMAVGDNASFRMKAILPPTLGEEQALYSNLGIGGYKVISAKTENLDRLLELVDYWVFSEEGSMLTTYGIEDDTYTVDESGIVSRVFKDGVASKLDFDARYGVMYTTFWSFTPDYFGYSLYDETASDLLNDTWNTVEPALVDGPPTIMLSAEDQEAYNEFLVDLRDGMYTIVNQFIMGQRDMSEWDEAIAEAEDLGLAEYIDMLNATYARMQ